MTLYSKIHVWICHSSVDLLEMHWTLSQQFSYNGPVTKTMHTIHFKNSWTYSISLAALGPLYISLGHYLHTIYTCIYVYIYKYISFTLFLYREHLQAFSYRNDVFLLTDDRCYQFYRISNRLLLSTMVGPKLWSVYKCEVSVRFVKTKFTQHVTLAGCPLV